MKRKLSILAMVLLMTGCASTVHHVIKIPRTPENLQAYRECQRTTATAVGYDKEGYKDLTRKCLNTLNGATEQVAEGDEDFKKILPGRGCQLVESLFYGGYRDYFYYLCDVKDN
ncbi:MAG TPA: hypothetical protein PLT45_08715 [Smithella sp.]|nr:hypothetical protein [Smithella sp.]